MRWHCPAPLLHPQLRPLKLGIAGLDKRLLAHNLPSTETEGIWACTSFPPQAHLLERVAKHLLKPLHVPHYHAGLGILRSYDLQSSRNQCESAVALTKLHPNISTTQRQTFPLVTQGLAQGPGCTGLCIEEETLLAKRRPAVRCAIGTVKPALGH